MTETVNSKTQKRDRMQRKPADSDFILDVPSNVGLINTRKVNVQRRNFIARGQADPLNSLAISPEKEQQYASGRLGPSYDVRQSEKKSLVSSIEQKGSKNERNRIMQEQVFWDWSIEMFNTARIEKNRRNLDYIVDN